MPGSAGLDFDWGAVGAVGVVAAILTEQQEPARLPAVLADDGKDIGHSRFSLPPATDASGSEKVSVPFGSRIRPVTIALTGTLHDPNGVQLPALRQRGALLRQYGGVYLAVSPATDARVPALLAEHGVQVVPGGAEIGTARRAALRAAVADGYDAYLAIDFDRWLHWAGTYPEELAGLPSRIDRQLPRRWYACLGRTARAFATHPAVQRLTETVTNTAISLALGRRLDAVAGASWLSRAGAELVLPRSIETTNATDLEWPALIALVDERRIGMVRCEGLEFETAAFYPDAVAAAGGLDAWLRLTYDHPESWRARAQLSADSIVALARVLESSRRQSNAETDHDG